MSSRLAVAVALAVPAAGVAVAFTLGYELRGAGYDECAASQPWWKSIAVVIAPLLAVASEILVFAGRWPRRGVRLAIAVADTALLLWFGWFALALAWLSVGCGWF